MVCCPCRMVCEYVMRRRTSEHSQASFHHQVRTARARSASPRPSTNFAGHALRRLQASDAEAWLKPPPVHWILLVRCRLLDVGTCSYFLHAYNARERYSHAMRGHERDLRRRFAHFLAKANRYACECLSGDATHLQYSFETQTWKMRAAYIKMSAGFIVDGKSAQLPGPDPNVPPPRKWCPLHDTWVARGDADPPPQRLRAKFKKPSWRFWG